MSWQSRHGALLASCGVAARERRDPPFQRLRRALFEKVLRDVENGGIDSPAHGEYSRERLGRLIDDGLREASVQSLSSRERMLLEQSILAELDGLGPLDALMRDPTVSDVLVNGPEDVWVDRFGRLERTAVRFDDADHMLRLVTRLVAAQGRHLDEATPYVDVRMPDGSRLHASIPPISRGPVLAIRRSRRVPFTMDQLYACGTLSAEMGRFLSAAVRSGCSILISGGAASGKTTTLNVLAQFIPESERVVTIEETAELKLEHHHVVSLEARQANIEGLGGIGLRTLVRNALRLRADRIIVGEVRGDEVFEMLQAMNVGHAGSMTTVHANSSQDALRRLESLVLMAGVDLPSRAVHELLGSAFELVLHMKRTADGSRRMVSIGEVCTTANGGVTVSEIFRYTPEPSDGNEQGAFVATGHVPRFADRLVNYAPDVGSLFTPSKAGNTSP